MYSVKKLLNKSLSSSKQQSILKPSKITSKSQSFGDENSPPIDPNVQVIKPQFPHLSNPKKSPSKLSISNNNVLDFSKSDPINDHSSAPDNPPVKVIQ